MIRIKRMVHIGKRLRLDPLRAVYHQKRAFHSAHGTRHLIGEIYVAWRINKIEHIALTIQCRVINTHRIGLDGNPALALNIHTVQHLRLHIPFLNGSSLLDQPVSQSGLSVVNMRHDREVSDVR